MTEQVQAETGEIKVLPNTSKVHMSAQVEKIVPAFIKSIQATSGAVKKNSKNPHLKNEYADLSAVIETSRQSLAEQELLMISNSDLVGKTMTVTTCVLHASGQFIENSVQFDLRATDPQTVGGGYTYGRRYNTKALMNFADSDDDGNQASGVTEPAMPTDGQVKFARQLAEERGTKVPAEALKDKDACSAFIDDMKSRPRSDGESGKPADKPAGKPDLKVVEKQEAQTEPAADEPVTLGEYAQGLVASMESASAKNRAAAENYLDDEVEAGHITVTEAENLKSRIATKAKAS